MSVKLRHQSQVCSEFASAQSDKSMRNCISFPTKLLDLIFLWNLLPDVIQFLSLLKVAELLLYEPPHGKTNKMACAPSEDSDQPVHPPSLIRVFAVRMKKAWVLSYPLSAPRRLWSDWADAQADLSLRWAHIHFVGFVTRRLICGFVWKMVAHKYEKMSVNIIIMVTPKSFSLRWKYRV